MEKAEIFSFYVGNATDKNARFRYTKDEKEDTSMKVAFFDTKPYDKKSFDRYASEYGVKIKYFETKLNEDTADLANGFDAVCVFVNDTVNARVL